MTELLGGSLFQDRINGIGEKETKPDGSPPETKDALPPSHSLPLEHNPDPTLIKR